MEQGPTLFLSPTWTCTTEHSGGNSQPRRLGPPEIHITPQECRQLPLSAFLPLHLHHHPRSPSRLPYWGPSLRKRKQAWSFIYLHASFPSILQFRRQYPVTQAEKLNCCPWPLQPPDAPFPTLSVTKSCSCLLPKYSPWLLSCSPYSHPQAATRLISLNSSLIRHSRAYTLLMTRLYL